jgi:hypothetical protein
MLRTLHAENCSLEKKKRPGKKAQLGKEGSTEKKYSWEKKTQLGK